MRKEFNPDTRRCLVYVAAVSLFWNTNITDVIRKRSIGYFRVALQSFRSVHTVRNDNTLHPLYLMSSINCVVYPTGETTELRSVSFSIFPWCVWRILVGVYHHDYGGVSACAISNNIISGRGRVKPMIKTTRNVFLTGVGDSKLFWLCSTYIVL